MTSIPTLLQIGNCYFLSLLQEAESYIRDLDWTNAYLCLEQYGRHMTKHREAEAELLYPRLLEQAPDLEAETAQLLHDHEELAKRSRLVTQYIYDKDRDGALSLMDQLIAITGGHWLAQIQTLFAASDTLSDQLLVQVAEKLAEAEDMPTLNSNARLH